MLTVELKSNPKLLSIIRAANPAYRKKKAWISDTHRVGIGSTYWDGGTRLSFHAVRLTDNFALGAPQFNPPQFGGPITDPIVNIPVGVAIVSTGVMCGKPATAHIYFHPDDMTKFLPAA